MISIAFVLGAIVGFLMAPGISERKYYYFQGFEDCLEMAAQRCERDAISIRTQLTAPGAFGKVIADTCLSCANWIRELKPKADDQKTPENFTVYSRGLDLAIEDCQRMRNSAISRNYKEAYITAMDEVLVSLKAMASRSNRNEYPHPTSEVQTFLK